MEQAARQMDLAYRGRAEGRDLTGSLVGLYGDGLPEALIRAAGFTPVHVKAPPVDGTLPRVARIEPVIERFMDPFASTFLHRLAAGVFDDIHAIAFVRDDASGLAAYQYALEMRRTGLLPQEGPALFLWNLVRKTTPAASRFNMQQVDDLMAELGATQDMATLESALAQEALRSDAINAMAGAGIDGATAHIWRNAGRWLDPIDHADLLSRAVKQTSPQTTGPSIGLIGSAVTDASLHGMLCNYGTIVADLQPHGATWPACHAGGPKVSDLLAAIAADPLHLRAFPPGHYRPALLDALKECDLVVSQVDPGDDSFGWEVPAIRTDLDAHGVTFVDLGFRPFRPDAAWLDAARQQIETAIGERP